MRTKNENAQSSAGPGNAGPVTFPLNGDTSAYKHLEPHSDGEAFDSSHHGSFSDPSDRKNSVVSGSSVISCHCVPFERASPRWWNPRFDSDILEGQYRLTSFPQRRLRFRYGLVYLFIITIMWTTYFGLTANEARTALTITGLLLSLIWFFMFFFTKTVHYARFTHSLSYGLCAILCSSTLSIFWIYQPGEELIEEVTTVGSFSIGVVTLLVIYTVVPLPLPSCVFICCAYSVMFESLNCATTLETYPRIVISRILLHVAIHVIGFHILVMNEVRSRGTFMIVGHSLVSRRQLEYETQLQDKMINSVMPPAVADWLKTEGQLGDDCGGEEFQRPIVFRPFNMNNMTNVSILFADIVGFTKMSSNKSASQLVDLLNDLFGRFDKLCTMSGCEKIATLGDCYYCVAGCPEPREDHADCCAKMGLAMITSIKEFDEDRNESVNMRVGIHTGTVLCGLVGRKRLKFDVFSKDVTFANKMESTGIPGRVHLSEVTKTFLSDDVELEPGPVVDGLSTYFIVDNAKPETENVPDVQAAGTTIHVDPPSSRASSNLLLDSATTTTAETHALTPTPPSPKPTDTVPNLYSTWPRRQAKLGPSKRRVTLTTIKDELNVSAYDLLSGKVDVLPPVDQDTSEEEDIQEEEAQLQGDSNAATACVERCTCNNNGEAEKPGSYSTLNSRKDSGVRSCRCSIPGHASVESNPIPEATLMHRSSGGYYTASPSSSVLDLTHSEAQPAKRVLLDVEADLGIANHVKANSCSPSIFKRLSVPSSRPFAFYHQLRKQSDQELIRVVQQDCMRHNYFVEPPLAKLSLCFLDEHVEALYRGSGHRDKDAASENAQTLNSRWLNTRIDIGVAILIFAIVATCCFILFTPPPEWIVVFVAAIYYQTFVVALFLRRILFREKVRERFDKIFAAIVEWKRWHTFGAILISLPVVSILSTSRYCDNQRHYSYVALVALVHFFNFTQLNSWMKACLAAIFGVVFVVSLRFGVCPASSTSIAYLSTHNHHSFGIEIWLVLAEIVLLNLILNREFEIGFRLNFHGSLLAAEEQSKMRRIKNQTDWLLHNIIPRHVADKLKSENCYSENHTNVGVIFASIVNFSEMYDESYMGGKEYLRVLNELVSDFDELLALPEFRNVDKIKTIGSTYMAASGLNAEIRMKNADPDQHLKEMMQFAIQLMRVVREFNKDLLEFNLILRIGFNHGDVTAGVIGTTKLYFDIWGDTVNIASRMDSTGVSGRIQCSEESKQVLERWYDFERRGTIFVKGKNDMNVHLLREPDRDH